MGGYDIMVVEGGEHFMEELDLIGEESKKILTEAGVSMEEFSNACQRVSEAVRETMIPVIDAFNNLAKFLMGVFKEHERDKEQVAEAITKGLVPPSLGNLAFEHRKFRVRNKNINRAIRELRIAEKRKR